MSEEKQTVLIVDDTAENIQVVSSLLRGQYKVKAAKSGEKALSIAATHPPPDLIILDVIMPELNGYEVCQRLQSDPSTAAIPVIFLSGNTEQEERQKGLALGAAGYLSKPVDPDELRTLVAACISR